MGDHSGVGRRDGGWTEMRLRLEVRLGYGVLCEELEEICSVVIGGCGGSAWLRVGRCGRFW